MPQEKVKVFALALAIAAWNWELQSEKAMWAGALLLVLLADTVGEAAVEVDGLDALEVELGCEVAGWDPVQAALRTSTALTASAVLVTGRRFRRVGCTYPRLPTAAERADPPERSVFAHYAFGLAGLPDPDVEVAVTHLHR